MVLVIPNKNALCLALPENQNLDIVFTRREILTQAYQTVKKRSG